ncbi:MAG: TAT-variant-translocated molybdopterin oxidoreductase, partial [Methanococcaceae archaeon]
MNNSNNDNQRDPNYWKSLSELHNSPESMEVKANEFMQGVTDDFDISKLSPLSRRKFLALLSASAAFAAAGCGKDKGEIIPYNKKPEEIIVGKANFYASTCTGCPNACGIVVKTREGRPIKIDGNPDHPVNLGKICAIGQASVLNLYDPGRLKMPLISNGGAHTSTTWQKADDEIIAALASASGKEIALITHKIVSPSAKKVIDGFGAKYPGLKVYSYELFDDNNRNEAWRKSYGSGSCPPVKWEDAKIIVALESDFLANEGHTIENVRRYSATRNAIDKKEFSRLYSVEGAMSVTGMNADYRLRLRPDAQFQFVTALINEIQQKAPAAGSSSLKDFAAKHKMSLKSINRLLTDLNSNRGSAIVYAGDNLPVEVHLAVNQLNEVLGNNKLYDSSQMPVTYVEPAGKEQWGSLIQNMNGGNVAAVIHFDTNPVYHLPADSGYRDALKNVKLSVAMTEQENETSALCRYVLPVHHALESWGDFNIRGNIYSLQQPVISPLYNSRQKEAVLVVWTSGSRDTYKENLYHDFIASNWEKDVFPKLNLPLTFKEFWLSALERGVVEGANSKVLTPVFRPESMSGLNSQQAGTGYLVYLKNNYSIGDGRYANNGWLQELPHPVSKIVWDNYAAISPATARELKLENNDKIEVKSGSRKVELPVFIQPGMADKVIVIELGYGRSRAGEVGTGVGVNANLLMTAAISGSRFILPDITIAKQPGSYELVSTQEQNSLDDAFLKDIHKQRGIIREGTVEEYKNNPDFLEKDKREQPSLNKEVQ